MERLVRKTNTLSVESAQAGDAIFARGLCFYKTVWLFALGSVIGFLLETVFCFIFKGYLESRQGMIYGPFNQIYGFGAVILAVLLLQVKKRGNVAVFAVGAAAGGLFEIICSYVQQQAFGTVSWAYKWMPFSIGGGRTNLLYMVFWGFLAIVYIRVVYPVISAVIERIRKRPGVILSWVIVVFMSVNLCLSAFAVARWTERQSGAPAKSEIDTLIDTYYPDERLQQIYPSMIRVNQEAA
ncbi:MAG: putative ABC transporter permease [Oscillospiraceae bacterium]|jgi:uncharacterized membrane protein|nr:putative ABC transporter permease [Oscillospiraceae bacterium]